MKKILDFSKVPLDKWSDLYNVTTELDKSVLATTQQERAGMMITQRSICADIKSLAETEVKEEADIDREIAEELYSLAKDGNGTVELPDSLLEKIASKKRGNKTE